MAWFGGLTEKEAIQYTRAADRRRLAISMATRLRTRTLNWLTEPAPECQFDEKYQ